MFCINYHNPKFLERFKCDFESENNKRKKSWVHSLAPNTFEVRRACWSSKMETGTNDKLVNYSYGLAQNKQQFGYYIIGTFLVHEQATSIHRRA